MKIYFLKFEVLPVEVLGSRAPSSIGLGEVVMNDFLFLLMVRNPTVVVFEAMNMVFPPSRIHPKVKVFGISISRLEIA